MAAPRKLWETNVGLRPATHIMSTFVCLAIVEVSELFGISVRTVQRWLKMWSESGDYRPKQNYQKGHSAKITDLAGFRQFVEANPGLPQKEM